MDRVGRLHIGEGADDHPPDRFDRIERQKSPEWRSASAFIMAASRPGRRGRSPIARSSSTRDQRSMMALALHQTLVHFAVEPVVFPRARASRSTGGGFVNWGWT